MSTLARVSRYFFFILFFVLMVFFVIVPFRAHWFCPFALVPSLSLLFRGVELVFFVGIVLGLLFIALSILLPRFFCGFICPIGTFQDLISIVLKPLQKKRINYQLNRRLAYISLVWLVIIFMGGILTKSVFCVRTCPIVWSFAIKDFTPPIITFIALGIFFFSGIIVHRGFCRYICPYGFLLSLPSKFAIFKIYKNIEVCNNCTLCNRSCPMGIDLCGGGEWVESRMCVSCMECLKACRKNGLSLRRKYE